MIPSHTISFSILAELGEDIRVFRNNKITIQEIERLAPRRIVISPGPCTPREAGISVDVIRYFAGKVPILGVCLGHQSIGAAFGGEIIRAPRLMHETFTYFKNWYYYRI